MKRFMIITVALLTAVFMAIGCAAPQPSPAEAQTQPAAGTQPTAETQPAETKPAETQPAEKPMIALVVNQRSGDSGPIDSMFAGADLAEKELGVTVKRLESEDPAAYEEDLRAMAKAGYQLIICTFPPMVEAAKVVAQEYPDVKFAGIFQYVNVDGFSLENYWDTEFRGEECFYVLGAMAATLTQSNKIGYLGGNESVGVYEAANGYMRGAKSVNPDITVDFMVVGSYEDPAKAKEISLAMIDKGVDVLQTDCGNSQVGVIEAAAERGVYVAGDVADNFNLCPAGFFSTCGVNFGANVYTAIETFLDGTFPGGTHSFMTLQTGAYFVPLEVLDKLQEANPDQAEKIENVRKVAQETIDKINAGEIVVAYDETRPDWDRIKNEQ